MQARFERGDGVVDVAVLQGGDVEGVNAACKQCLEAGADGAAVFLGKNCGGFGTARPERRELCRRHMCETLREAAGNAARADDAPANYGSVADGDVEERLRCRRNVHGARCGGGFQRVPCGDGLQSILHWAFEFRCS